MLDQVPRDHRHPQDGHRVAQHQEGIGARAFGAGEPVAQVHQHRRHHRRLDHAEQEADADQQVDIADHAGQGRQAAPEDQADENQLFDAAFLRVDGTRHLEEEVPEEKQRPQQGRQRRGDLQVIGHARGGGEAVVGTVEVGQAVSDEDDRDDVPPTAWGEACRLHDAAPELVVFVATGRRTGDQSFRHSWVMRTLPAPGAVASLPCRRAIARRGCRTSCREPPPRRAGGLRAGR